MGELWGYRRCEDHTSTASNVFVSAFLPLEIEEILTEKELSRVSIVVLFVFLCGGCEGEVSAVFLLLLSFVGVTASNNI